MKVLRYVLFFVVVIVATSFTGCSSAPKMASSPTPTVYQYAPEPQKRVPADEGSLASKHAKEVQKMRYAHEKRIMAMEMAAEEARIAREKNIAPPPAVAITNSPQVSVRYWTPDDPYGTGQAVPVQQPQRVVRYVYPTVYGYRPDTGLTSEQYWALRQYSIPVEQGGFYARGHYGYAGGAWHFRAPVPPHPRIILRGHRHH